MPAFTDQTGRTILLESIPQRIISLVPSQTELLFDLGLDEQVIGITKFCVHPPEWFYTKTRAGGTKKLHIDTIHQLQPDLIIANKEENVKEQIEELATDLPVWLTDVNNLSDALNMILDIGQLTSRNEEAKTLANEISTAFSSIVKIPGKVKAAYLIWQKPLMAVGNDTFIHDMLCKCGLTNIFANRARYPEITIEELKEANCELLLLSTEPYPFKNKHVQDFQNLLTGTQVMLVDGEFFSWYGSRLLQSASYFSKLSADIIIKPL